MELNLFYEIVQYFAIFFGGVGAVLIIYGGIKATLNVLLVEIWKRPISYDLIRRDFTNKIVFGLEFFIAGDIIMTLIFPSQEELLLLAVVVIIRTVLGYFLEKETEEYSLSS